MPPEAMEESADELAEGGQRVSPSGAAGTVFFILHILAYICGIDWDRNHLFNHAQKGAGFERLTYFTGLF